MGKRKEPTTTSFMVYLRRTVTQVSQIQCRVRARLDRTKKRFIENSSRDLAEHIPEHLWDTIDDSGVKVDDILTENDFNFNLKCCEKCGHPLTKDNIVDLGEVDD